MVWNIYQCSQFLIITTVSYKIRGRNSFMYLCLCWGRPVKWIISSICNFCLLFNEVNSKLWLFKTEGWRVQDWECRMKIVLWMVMDERWGLKKKLNMILLQTCFWVILLKICELNHFEIFLLKKWLWAPIHNKIHKR